MSTALAVPMTVMKHATDERLVAIREQQETWRSDDADLRIADLTPARLADLIKAAAAADDRSFGRVVEAVERAYSGKFDKKVPKLTAAPAMIIAYLVHHKIDGWLYRSSGDRVEAYLVTSVRFEEPTGQYDKPKVMIGLSRTGVINEDNRRSRERGDSGRGVTHSSITLFSNDVMHKTVADILTAEGFLVETPALRQAYDEQTEHHREVVTTGYTEQYRLTGVPVANAYRDDETPRTNRKVIMTTPPGSVIVAETATSSVFADPADLGATEDLPRRSKRADEPIVTLPVPLAHMVDVFDLSTHTYLRVHSIDLTRYVYDSSLADKLVLPASHRDLLDILTTDIATFTGDIIEGKSAGNVILAKGVPGVGKTLTAEVYSELIERPLYSIHSGALGVTADKVRENLEVVFKRAKAWNAVFLLDEADVFVNARGTDITQNAIVAEFLRTMEYFDGLMFMTTNRAANIDEAIISRCAAIISYDIPGWDDAVRIWRVLADNFAIDLSNLMIGQLATAFHDIAPRDVKMLLRLAARVAAHHDEPLTTDTFRQVAMFRGLTYHTEETP